jgi:deoxycytidine triphosphate deaminase
MILSQPEIRAAVEKGEIRFEPPLEERQWGEASVDLRLGLKFTKLLARPGAPIFSMAKASAALPILVSIMKKFSRLRIVSASG